MLRSLPGFVVNPAPLGALWASALEERDAYILKERLSSTLEQIGERLGISRERVRQLERQARVRLKARLTAEYDLELGLLLATLASQLVVDDAYLASLFGEASERVTRACMGVVAVVPVSGWGFEAAGWWTSRPEAVKSALTDLVSNAPFPDAELTDRALNVGLPTALRYADLLAATGSPVRRHAAGPWWVRRTAVHRDATYLWLLERGEPEPIGAIAEAIGIAENAAREGMRRDDRFTLLRPLGHWSLVEWNLPNAGYNGALEAVVSVLDSMGPMPYETLRKEVQGIYPVTQWRIAQCLNSALLGRMPNDDIGLERYGAVPIEEEAPKRPSNVAVSEDGNLMAFTLPVDVELLRGSGIVIPRFIGWQLGLRHAPESREFRMSQSQDTLTITRNLSGTQITALRRWAVELGVVEGCRLAVTLRLDSNKVRIVHGCSEGLCALNAEN